jgi:hypothetical protein
MDKRARVRAVKIKKDNNEERFEPFFYFNQPQISLNEKEGKNGV